MFCGGDESFGPMNKEHFVPKCLWSGPRPNLTRTVPAHVECNKACSDDNEYFRDALVLEDGSQNHPEARKLQDGALLRKIRKRPGGFKHILKNSGYRPVFSPSGLYVEHAFAFVVDWPRMQRVLFNIMKGVFYTVYDEPMPKDWKLG